MSATPLDINSVSESIAAKIRAFNPEQLDCETAQAALRLLIDTIGVTFAAAQTKSGRLANQYAGVNDHQTPFANLIGSADLRAAVFAPAFCAHTLDFDDMYRPGGVHLGCVIVPVALGVAARSRLNAKALLAAIAVGAELSACVAEAIHDAHHRMGFHITATSNVFGAVASFAHLRKLSLAQIVNALGLAGDQAAGLRQYHFDVTSTKALHAARAAQVAVDVLMLASAGFIGPKRIFEGKFGFCNAFTANRYSLDPLTTFLNGSLRIVNVSYKPWPCGRGTHAAVQAALSISSRLKTIELHNIQRVEVHTYERAVINLNKPAPVGSQRCLSIQYCVARALIDGQINLETFDESISEPRSLHELISRVEVIEALDMTRSFEQDGSNATSVRVIFKDGSIFFEEVTYPVGSPQNPMSDGDLKEKFLDNVGPYLGINSAELFYKELANLKHLNATLDRVLTVLSAPLSRPL